MSLKDKSLILIERGEWVFDLVGPLFREGLVSRLGTSTRELPMMELSLHAYGVSEMELHSLKRIGRFFEEAMFHSRDSETLQRLATGVYATAKPIPLSRERKTAITMAEKFIAGKSMVTGELLERWISTYLLLEDVHFRSGSSPHAFGCIFLGEKMDSLAFENLAVSIVHEMAHQELFLFNLIDRLVNAEADFNLVHAPFQGIKRPPIGRLHSLYALFRMVEFEKLAELPHEKHQQLLLDTIHSFEEFELTDFAKQLLRSIERRLSLDKIVRRAYA
ncbi:MAG: hypothetical protein KF865_01615 [Bdellovibrionaceae bacterium]|nr:hypothetical protein [Pseudobdellovibrionaceae bacterium]